MNNEKIYFGDPPKTIKLLHFRYKKPYRMFREVLDRRRRKGWHRGEGRSESTVCVRVHYPLTKPFDVVRRPTNVNCMYTSRTRVEWTGKPSQSMVTYEGDKTLWKKGTESTVRKTLEENGKTIKGLRKKRPVRR